MYNNNNNNVNNNLIVRYNNNNNSTLTAPYDNINANMRIKCENDSSMIQASSSSHVKYRKVYTKHNNNNIRQFVTKRKNNVNAIRCDLNNSQVSSHAYLFRSI